MSQLRKKSPRAPSLSLPEALERALTIYDKEGQHVVPSSVVAQDIGYKNATSGAALSALAAIKYYGLLESQSRGMLSVSEKVEDYKFTTDQKLKRDLLIGWLKCPKIYSELLSTFSESLPSDAAVIHQLIKMGFVEKTAQECLKQFKASVDFAEYYSQENLDPNPLDDPDKGDITDPEKKPNSPGPLTKGIDRIPVRLTGGRKAWLEVPLPFYEKDKEMIKRYVDIIATDDEE